MKNVSHVEGILESGTEFTILSQASIPKEFWGIEYSTVQLKSAFDEIVEVILHVFPIEICYERELVNKSIWIQVTLCEKFGFPCLLPPDIYDFLKQNTTLEVHSIKEARTNEISFRIQGEKK